MSTVVVAFYDVDGTPLTGLTPTFAQYKTLAGIDTAAPSVSELGGGLYAFDPSATNLSTGIAFLLDGGATASPRYFSDGIDSAAAAAAATTVSVTGVNLFGVTFTNLYTRHFPQWSQASTESNPSSATVAEIIDECAATLEAKLLQEDIDATELLVTNAAAYLWCRETLRLMAAIKVLPVATQQVPELSKDWQRELTARWQELADEGYLALGSGVSAPTEQPDGPTTFIDSMGLSVANNNADASSLDFPFHKDDQL